MNYLQKIIMKKVFSLSTLVLFAASMFITSCGPKEVPAESLSMEKELTMYVDSTYQLKAVITPENATGKIAWKSNDSTVVSVSEAGLVKALKKGQTIITASLDKEVAACQVTVLNNPVTLELSMVDIAQKKCTVSVKASDQEGYYYCGYATPADVKDVTDEKLAETVLKNIQAMLETYKQYGYNYTLKDVLAQGDKNMIASGLTANTDYIMFAFGVDIDTEKAGKKVTRLPFKTKEVVPSSMTFTIELDSIAKIRKISKGDTTYTYNGYFKCKPSNEKETYVFTGVDAKSLAEKYGNDPMKCLTDMEAAYDTQYASQGGFEGVMVKAGTRDIYASNMVHNTTYVLFAAGYDGGFSTKATKFEYTFQHPDSIKKPMPAYRSPIVETADEIDLTTDFRVFYFPGMCH
jgi:hypothetical protein